MTEIEKTIEAVIGLACNEGNRDEAERVVALKPLIDAADLPLGWVYSDILDHIKWQLGEVTDASKWGVRPQVIISRLREQGRTPAEIAGTQSTLTRSIFNAARPCDFATRLRDATAALDRGGRVAAYVDAVKAARDGQGSYARAVELGEAAGIAADKLAALKSKAADAQADAAGKLYEKRHLGLPIELPRTIRDIADHIGNETRHPNNMQLVMAAITMVGMTAGKRLRYRNGGRVYYPNLSTAILCPSGMGKTAVMMRCHHLLRNVTPAAETLSTSTIDKFIGSRGYHLPPLKARDKSERIQRRQEMERLAESEREELDGNAIIIDEMRAFIETMIPSNATVQKGQLFCELLESAKDILSDTQTYGDRFLPNACMSFLGFSQSDPWNEEMITPRYKQGGLAYRIIPVNSEQLDLRDWERTNATEDDALSAFRSARDLAEASGIAWADVHGAGDELGDLLTECSTHNPVVAAYVAERPKDWDILRGKIIQQGGKVAMILAFAAAVDEWRAAGDFSPREPLRELDAVPYLQAAYQLVATSHVTNAFHVVQHGEQAELQDRIIGHVKRSGGKGRTKAELMRSTGLNGTQLWQLLTALVEGGTLAEDDTRKGTKRYRLT